ncbi:MAG: chemotaxis protein CheB [Spirochaetales bacterium]|nr:chemotaxis protein CheB [Spirochaetales bacterium]
MSSIQAIVIGTSAGGLKALSVIIPKLKPDFPAPIVILQHMSQDSENETVNLLDRLTPLKVKEADEKETLVRGTIYFAAPNYHLLIERNKTFSLSVDPKVNYSRPSIDVLFETAAEAYQEGLVAVILTGANNDGEKGAIKIVRMGGRVIVQDPETAEAPLMPLSVIENCKVEVVLPLEDIADYLNTITQEE